MSAGHVSASFKMTRYGRSSKVGTSEHDFNAEPTRISTPSATHSLASSIDASPRSLASGGSRYEWSLKKINSGTLITFAKLSAGQGRFATERRAVSENSDPSVAIRILSPHCSAEIPRASMSAHYFYRTRGVAHHCLGRATQKEASEIA